MNERRYKGDKVMRGVTSDGGEEASDRNENNCMHLPCAKLCTTPFQLLTPEHYLLCTGVDGRVDGRVRWEGGMGGWDGRVGMGEWGWEGGDGRVGWEGGDGRVGWEGGDGRVGWESGDGRVGMGGWGWEGGDGRVGWEGVDGEGGDGRVGVGGEERR